MVRTGDLIFSVLGVEASALSMAEAMDLRRCAA
jgi:hypothetical protein